MREFESREQAEKHFREVLGYGGWDCHFYEKTEVPNAKAVEFYLPIAPDSASAIYYVLKPKPLTFIVPVEVHVEALTAHQAVAIVSDRLPVRAHVIGPAKEVANAPQQN